MEISRRAVLIGAGAGLLPLPAGAEPVGQALYLNLGHPSGDRASGVYFRDGVVDDRVLWALDVFMRDREAGVAAQMDRRLYWVLGLLQYLIGRERTIVVTSGLRTAATNARAHRRRDGSYDPAAYNSHHLRGEAADVTVPGLPIAVVARVLLWMQQYGWAGGLGFYSGRNFVHVDVGRVRTWRG